MMEQERLNGNISIAMQMRKGDKTPAVDELKAAVFNPKKTTQTLFYPILKTIRGTVPFWQAFRRDVFAMFRLVGPPTWFLSLSAAENLWDDLIVNLVLTDMYVKDREVDLSNWRDTHMDEVQKEYKRVKDGRQVERLVRKYPAAKLFDRRLQVFLEWMQKARPVGKVNDYVVRIEFQARGCRTQKFFVGGRCSEPG